MKNPSTSKKKSNLRNRIILSVLGLILVGGAFYLFWPQSDTNKSIFMSYFDKSEQDETSTPTQSPTTGPSNSPDAMSQTDTLTTPNWNVKFSVPSALQDTEVKYTERKSNDKPPVTYYAFTTSRIQGLGSKCQTQPFGDTVILYRYTEKPVAVPDGELVNENPINGYYYVVTSPIASCSGFDTNGNLKSPSQVEMNDRAALKEFVKSIQAN